MKRLCMVLLVVFTVMATSCDEKDDKRMLFLPKGESPEDIVNDEQGSEDFKFQMIHEVVFDLQVYDQANNPLSGALIRVASGEGDIMTAFTEGNGTAGFKISINNTVESITLTIEHASCVSRTIEIENVQDLALVSRSIFLELSDNGKAKPDRDEDGVSDDSDEFPDDPFLIGTVRGEFTIAYEDQWPAKGDADFNDLVVRLGITEYIDNNNKVSKIVVTSKLLAAGAGYKNQFWIGVLDKDYLLIFNPKQDLNGQWNTRVKDEYVDGPVHTEEIILASPVARDKMDAMPYDPYIKCNGNDKNQVHLSFVKSKFLGDTLDAENFPWALLVPADWGWPAEGSSIFDAYPQFKLWYESKGAEYKDWYLHPDADKVFNAPSDSALSAYLLKVSGRINTGAVIGVLAAMILLVVVLGVRRRRRAGV